VAGGVDPERPARLAVEIAGEARVDDRKPRHRQRRGQLGVAVDIEPKMQAVIDQILQLCDRLRAFVGAIIELDDHRYFARQRSGEDFCDAIPMPIEDDSDHDALQQHDRHAKDEERALI
jgi:hypothetical protein